MERLQLISQHENRIRQVTFQNVCQIDSVHFSVTYQVGLYLNVLMLKTVMSFLYIIEDLHWGLVYALTSDLLPSLHREKE